MENQEIILAVIAGIIILTVILIIIIFYLQNGTKNDIQELEDENKKLKEKTVNMEAINCITNFKGIVNVSGINVSSSLINLETQNINQKQQIDSINQELKIIEEEMLKIANNTKTLFEDTDGAFFSENLKVNGNLEVLQKSTFNEIINTGIIETDVLNSNSINSKEINTLLLNSEFISSDLGAKIMIAPAGYIITDNYYPLITSMKKFTPNNINNCYIVLNPGFKLKLYSSENYSVEISSYNNTNGNIPKSFKFTSSVTIKSIKLYYSDVIYNIIPDLY